MLKIVLSMLLFACISVNAQTAESHISHSQRMIYAEFLGASILVGANYDSRINEESRLGYRVGLAYTLSDIGELGNDGCGGSGDEICGFNIPVEINYLVGWKKRKSKLDLGAGINVGYYKKGTKGEGKMFGYFCFFNVGYRFQPKCGVAFRIGISPKFDFGGNSGIKDYVWITSCVPYVSIGYAFR